VSKKYILAFDQGTTSSRAVVYNALLKPIESVSRRHEQIYDEPGWVCHNAQEIFFNVVEAGKQAVSGAGINICDIVGIGVTNQRETTVVWDKVTGEPVCDAIVWLDKRTVGMCRKIKTDGFEPTIREKTGLLADSYFSATKMKWILENVPEAEKLAKKGRLAFGTMDSYLIFRLTGGKKHITDYSNASRTMLFNIKELKWDCELLKYFGIPEETLPEVVSSSGIVGHTECGIFGCEIPIAGIAGDQHAALFGQNCLQEGSVKNTYGTGCFILQNTGKKIVDSTKSGLITTIAWNIGGETTYAVEGSVFNAGSAIEWLINGLKLISDIKELEYILSETRDSDGVCFVPAFSGLGAPEWDMSARGSVFGLTLASGKNEIVRAVCEAIAFQVKDALDYMELLTGVKVSELKVDGGVSRNDYIMQFQADVLGKVVFRPQNIETTALGAAKLAGLAVGLFGEEQDCDSGSLFEPKMEFGVRDEKYAAWRKAVERSKGWIG